jgi:hypothetical protein
MSILKTAKLHGIPAAKSPKLRRLEAAQSEPNHFIEGWKGVLKFKSNLHEDSENPEIPRHWPLHFPRSWSFLERKKRTEEYPVRDFTTVTQDGK